MTPPKPVQVIDRESEWRVLTEMWSSARPELVFVVGARRVGKTFLLAPLTSALSGLYYQASRRTSTEQLAELTRLAGARFDDAALLEGAPLPSWESFFRYVVRKAGGDPFLLVLDEFPYLEEASSGLSSVIQALWDQLPTTCRLKLVLAGSHVASMRRLEAADQPLHARRTRRLVFAPFRYVDAAAFYPNYSPIDRLRAFGTFGGFPGHLTLIDANVSLRDNICAQLLEPSARLHDEAERILDAYVKEPSVHYAIVHAIANGNETWDAITRAVGKSSGSLSRPMHWLLEMEIVVREVPITVTDPHGSRRSVYRLTDPYVAFWMRHIRPLRSAGIPTTLSPDLIWERHIAPRFDDWMGRVFEAVCRSFVSTSRTVPFIPDRVGRWWSADGGAEVDVVAVGPSEMLVAECKWGAVGEDDLTALRRNGARLAAEVSTLLSGGDAVARIHAAMFSGRGEFSPALRKVAADQGVTLLGPDDLYASG